MVKKIYYTDVVTLELLQGAIEHYSDGYIKDYHLLHCLMRLYAPKVVMEVGTHIGTGTKIIKNALGPDTEVYSLDLPPEKANQSAMHPISEGRSHGVGSACDLEFTQLFGDSWKFDFAAAVGGKQIDGWWIDGDHDYEHVNYETVTAAKGKAKLIVWHDADAVQVWDAITDGLKEACGDKIKGYDLFRIVDTRVAFALENKVDLSTLLI